MTHSDTQTAMADPTQKQIELRAGQMYEYAAKRVFSRPENWVLGNRSAGEQALWRERALHDLRRGEK